MTLLIGTEKWGTTVKIDEDGQERVKSDSS